MTAPDGYDALTKHKAPWECNECGGPESGPVSHGGCPNCGAQGEIVPRSTVLRRRLPAVSQDLLWLNQVMNDLASDPRPKWNGETHAYKAHHLAMRSVMLAMHNLQVLLAIEQGQPDEEG